MMRSLITCLVAGSQYLLHPQKLGAIEETINPDAIVPVTLLTTSEIFSDVDALLKLYDTYDDVFVPEFGAILVEKSDGHSAEASYLNKTDLAQDVYSLSNAMSAEDISNLPSGPYFLHGPNLHQAWRLYGDNLDAFTFGVIPEDINKPDSFQPLDSLSASAIDKAIAVPSRLYHPPPWLRKPLSGLRISIPDTMPLKGARTLLSSKAWAALYNSPAAATAEYVQSLLDMGAIIVGKTKVSQFSAGEQWIDAMASWSPRNLYQTTLGSAAGAAAALAGYEWLHHSVAQDAIGEDLANANFEGLYTLRASPSSLSLRGAQLSSSHYDSGILMSRSIRDLESLSRAALTLSDTEVSLPRRLLYLNASFGNGPSTEQDLMEQFVSAIEKCLHLKAEPINLTAVWAHDPPSEACGEDLTTYMGESAFKILCYDYSHAYDDFEVEYRNSFHRDPFVEANPKFRWTIGRKMTKESYNQHLLRVRVFQQWFNDKIMFTNLESGNATVMIMPHQLEEIRYRYETPKAPASITGLSPGLLSPVLQVPQLSVPFAQLPYRSHASGSVQYRPVFGSILGPSGSDLMLVGLVQRAFALAHWRTTVETGPVTFPLGGNGRHGDNGSVFGSAHNVPRPPHLQIQMPMGR